MNRKRIAELLLAQTLRFFDGHMGRAPRVGDVARAIRARDLEALRIELTHPGEAALFAAIALGAFKDPAGLAVLRDPHAHYCTNSCKELALALCARLVLKDVKPPLAFINAAMLGELAVLVGAFPPPE